MSALFVLMLATGVLLIFAGATEDPHRVKPARHRFETPKVSTMAASLGVGLAVFLMAAATSGSAVVAVAVSAAAASIPLSRERASRARASAAVRDQWPDLIAMLVASIRAGVALPQACAEAAVRSPEGLRSGMGSYLGAYRASGSFRIALDRMRTAFADPVADRICVALLLAHEVGGTDLVRVLRTLADQVRDEQRVRKEVLARWSWTLTAARVAALAPWAVLGLMSTRPEAASAYDSPAGVTTIVMGAVATLVGYRLLLRAGRLPSQRRLGP